MIKKSTLPKKTTRLSKEEITDVSKQRIPRKGIIFPIVFVALVILVYLFKGIFITAMVNGQPISRLAVIGELEKQGGKATLDSMIVKTLVLQESQRRKVSVTQKDIDAQLKTIEGNISQQGMTLDQALQSQGMKKSDLADQIKLQLLVEKMAGGKVTVTDKEVEDYIKNQQVQSGQTTDQEIPKDQVRKKLEQQKVQQNIQDFIANLRQKAKITYFTQY